MLYTGWLWLDPAVSLSIAVVILLGTWGLLRRSEGHRVNAQAGVKKQPRDAIDFVKLNRLAPAIRLCIVGAASVFAARAGWTQMYWRIDERGWGWFSLSVVCAILLHDTYFYWTHRMMHHPKLFRWFHRTHHLSHNPTPWTAYAFDPLEAFEARVHLVQRGVRNVETIQVLGEALQLAVVIIVQQLERNAGIVIPFRWLADLRTHEE